MSYSRKQLEAFGEPFGECATRKKISGGYICGGGGGGSSAPPASQTITQTAIPDYAKPYVETMLGKQQALSDTAYNPFPGGVNAQVAKFSPLQQQAQSGIAGLQLPGQFGQASDMARSSGAGELGTVGQAGAYGAQGAGFGQQASGLSSPALAYGAQGAGYGGTGVGYGAQAAQLANTALGYGQGAANIGQMAFRAQDTGEDVSRQSQNLAQQQALTGQQYGQMATDPRATQALMNPYMQNVVDVQQREAQRQADIAGTSRGANFARAGAFGGGRQAIENAEAARNLATQKGDIEAKGLNAAFQNAQAQQQFGANLNLQGLTGAQQGLGTALQGGQLGLSGLGTALQGQQGALSGVGQAGSMYGLGMQGAGLGLQGTQAGLAGVNAANQAYQTGIQGAGMGLQGVGAQQAGFAQAGNQATNLSNIGNQQLGAQQGIYNAQTNAGAQQQALEQAQMAQAQRNFDQQIAYPQQQLSNMSNMVRGLPMTGTGTAQTYQAPPSALNQIAGLGAAAYGVSKIAKGGKIKEKKRPAGLAELALSRMG